MRISDWSSDVCSSDLPASGRSTDGCRARRCAGGRWGWGRSCAHYRAVGGWISDGPKGPAPAWTRSRALLATDSPPSMARLCRLRLVRRSEEHTSELQSLMRISYAVVCFKKKQPLKSTPTSHTFTLTYVTPHI